MYKLFKKLHISPYLAVALSFLLVIFLGSLILWTPWAYQNGKSPDYINALFTAVSAVCVTGLNVFPNLVDTFTVFGKIVIAVLIQLGGLGFITIFTFILTIFGNRLSILDRYMLKEALSINQYSGVTTFVQKMVVISLIVEAAGTIPFMFVFIPQYGLWPGIGKAVFHSISSFNNAGFDLIGSESLIPYHANYVILINTMILVFLGSLGFLVIDDLIHTRKARNWKVLTKVSLTMSLSLTIFGGAALWLLDGFQMSLFDGVFQSVIARTAGFSSIPMNGMSVPAQSLFILLMFIGASPLSTGGGTKNTTWFVILLTMISFIRGRKVRAFNRTYAMRTFIQATTLIFFGVFVLFTAVLLIEGFEKNNIAVQNYGLSGIIFESVSAFGTVGNSLGITTSLSVGSKIVLTVLMFLGRVGPMTLIATVSDSMNKEEKLNYRYIEADLVVG